MEDGTTQFNVSYGNLVTYTCDGTSHKKCYSTVRVGQSNNLVTYSKVTEWFHNL